MLTYSLLKVTLYFSGAGCPGNGAHHYLPLQKGMGLSEKWLSAPNSCTFFVSNWQENKINYLRNSNPSMVCVYYSAITKFLCYIRPLSIMYKIFYELSVAWIQNFGKKHKIITSIFKLYLVIFIPPLGYKQKFPYNLLKENTL